MIPTPYTVLANHLWQSTLCAAVAWLLTIALRKNHAAVRHRLWVAASIKFLIPFPLLVSLWAPFAWQSPAAPVHRAIPTAVEHISQPFTPALPTSPASAADPAPGLVPFVLFLIWLCGFAGSILVWLRLRRRFRAAMRSARLLPLDLPIPVMTSPARLEPGVFGIRKPILLLPEGIADRLTPAQLQSILAHELCHVRRRDNLAAAIHMLVESIFWFHPVVWWIGSRLVDERERACDEEVMRSGNEPHAYAEGILNVCKLYLQSPLPCASGVTGSDLKKRIEAIVNHRLSSELTLARKLLLAAAGLVVIAGPIVVGILNPPATRAQSNPAAPVFEVASVKPSDPKAGGMSLSFTPGGGVTATNVTLLQLIGAAYGITCDKLGCDRISGGPSWIDSARFDVIAKSPETVEAARQIRQRLQTLLADRFHLVVRRTNKEMPVYHLVLAKNGPKFEEYTGDQPGGTRGGNGEITAERGSLMGLVNLLAQSLKRPVIDHTGLKGRYSFKLQWTPDPVPAGAVPEGEKTPGPPPSEFGPSLFTAIQEQLGLKLEPQKGPVEYIFIESARKPDAN